MYSSQNPFNGKHLKAFEMLDKRHLENKLSLSQKRFGCWKTTTYDRRAELFAGLAQLLEQNKAKYARLITLEMGKPLKEAINEVEKCTLLCKYYAENAEKQLKPDMVSSEASKSYISYQPLGAILAIMPWNYPFWQVFRFAVPSLMAGNVALLKHAANVPQCAAAIEEAFLEAGFEEGIFQNLFVDVHAIESVIASNAVSAITLTGSERAGSEVASLAGKHLKKTVLELGGSNAFLVLEDANIQLAAESACLSRTMNNGQTCTAAKRFLVHQAIYDEFVEKLVGQFQNLRFGNPLEWETDYSCLARKDLAESLEKQVQKSLEMGAKLAFGSDTSTHATFKPSILLEVNPEMPAFKEELFGPVAAVVRTRNEEEAVALANNSVYGLGASIWTQNTERGEQIAQRIEAGSCFINSITKSVISLPFGGIKRSGYGRELSVAGIREFVNMKTIFVK